MQIMIIIDGKHIISIHWKQFLIYMANAYYKIQFELLTIAKLLH